MKLALLRTSDINDDRSASLRAGVVIELLPEGEYTQHSIEIPEEDILDSVDKLAPVLRDLVAANHDLVRSSSRPPVGSTHGGDWLDAKEAAAHVGMSVRALYAAVGRRQIPTSRLGRRLRFNREGLDRLLARPSRSSRRKS